MSKIDRLSIQGIRSFSPNSKEVIQFFTPLTLIIGDNGAGKTSSLECLKYAATGDMPPNSKGGAFVHDPKLCGEKEVLAQVKLAFNGAEGTRYVVTRNLQLTVKKTTRSLKTLEGTLQVVRDNDRETISSKVMVLDSEVPRRLGVSAAVLDAVIFCHQDESLWPMSEPAALKKKFDEIFEAQKYTKAIDNLKVLRKKKGELLTKYKGDEAHHKVLKDKADKSEKRSRHLQAEIEGNREDLKEISRKIRELEEAVKEKNKQKDTHYNVVTDLKSKREQLGYRSENIRKLRRGLEELPGDDESLERALAQYEDKVNGYKEEKQESDGLAGQLKKDVADARKDLTVKAGEKGKHQSDKDKYDRQLVSRKEMVQAAAQRYGMPGFDGNVTDREVHTFSGKLEKLIGEKKTELSRLRKHNAKEADEAGEKISSLEGRRSARNQEGVTARRRLTACDTRATVLQNELKGVNADENAKMLLDSELSSIQSKLSRARADEEQAGHDGLLRAEKDTLRALEDESQRLGEDLVECSRLATERAQLDFRKSERKERQNKLDSYQTTWKDKFSAMLGPNWAMETLSDSYDGAKTRQSNAVDQAKKAHDKAREKHNALSYRLKGAQDMEKSKTSEMKGSEKAVLDFLRSVNESATGIDDYEGEVTHYGDRVEELRSDLNLLGALEDYYKQCQDYLNKKKGCRLCERPFGDGDAAAMQRLRKKIDKRMNSETAEAKSDLDEAMEIHETLLRLRQPYDLARKLADELPGTKAEIKSLEAESGVVQRELDDVKAALDAAEDQMQDLDGLSNTVLAIAQTMASIRESESQITRIMSQQASSVSARSADEIQELLAACNEKIRASKDKTSRWQTERQRLRDQASALELEQSEIRNKISNAERQLDRRSDLQKQIKAIKDDHGKTREEIAKVNEELEKLEPEIEQAKSLRDAILQKGRNKEQGVAEERDAVSSTLGELRLLEADIEDYVARGGPGNITSNERAISTLEKRIARTEKDLQDATTRATELQQKIDKADSTKTNLGNNIQYREEMRTLQRLRGDIDELEARNAQEDYDNLVAEIRGYDRKKDMLRAEEGSITGQMKQKDDELGLLLDEWNRDYKDAGLRYRKSHIHVETTKAGIEDLGRFSAALDKAVMQYHGLKMEEVNRVAGELWQATYQGTDIDSILIRSDAETASGRRSYNYRLCMVKQDTEMDMRGRCSAGQKVLASIIIRLALAESFGVNCGLIALDEPTTNLDRDNIKSLAEALHGIIKARQAQSNFQLIVITHDEDFLRHMRCSDFCDSFYRIRRDDRQNSVITRESITKVL